MQLGGGDADVCEVVIASLSGKGGVVVPGRVPDNLLRRGNKTTGLAGAACVLPVRVLD